MDKFSKVEGDPESESANTADKRHDKQEHLYRAMADALPCGVWAFDNQLHTLFVNPALSKILGYSADDLAERKLASLRAEGDEAFRFPLDYYLERKRPFQTALRHKNGLDVWCDITLTPLLDEDGGSFGILAYIEDLTQQKQEKKQEVEVDPYYLKLVAQFPKTGVMIYDHDLRFHAVYGNFYKVGLTPSDIEGHIIDEVYPKDFADEVAIPMRRALQGEIVVMEKQFLDRFHWLIFAPQQEAQGYVPYGMILIQNITERKYAEMALREGEEFYRAIFDTFFEGLIIAVEGVIVDVNHAVEEMTGYKQGELIGQTPEMIVPPEWREVVRQRAKNQITHVLEGAIQRKDGSVFPVESQAVIIPYKGKSARLVAVRDITERKEAEAKRLEAYRIQLELEKAIELQKQKDYFLSLVSHEFRTPLAVARSSTEILRRYFDRLTAEEHETHFDRVLDQIDKLTDMVDDVLIVTRSDMGKVNFEPKFCDIDALCQEIVANVSHVYPQTTFEYMPQLQRKTFILDTYLVEHILSNLLANGAKYSPTDGRVRLRVNQNESGLRFEIEDNGIGIPEKDRAHIFEPFHRASNVGEIRGTGMGLSIVKRFVELHQGNIEWTSEPGKGTTFIINIPAK